MIGSTFLCIFAKKVLVLWFISFIYFMLLIETQYLPPIAAIAQMAQNQSITIEANEHYQKGGYRNRCHIATSNGVLALSVPLQKGKHQQTPIREVRIAHDTRWQAQHWQSIRSAYGKSPFWEYYADRFSPIYEKKNDYLLDWNLRLLEEIIRAFKLKCDIQLTDAYKQQYHSPIVDARNSISPKTTALGATLKPYSQVFSEKFAFFPNLSGIDLLFCTGNYAKEYL
jgi:WbqC-like protein family